MTDKQLRFCEEYVKDHDTARAYMAAYQSVKKKDVARSAGCRLLTNVNVKSRIDELEKEIYDEAIADAIEVRTYLTRGMRQELEEEVIVVEGVGEGCSEARIIKKKCSIKESNKCAELLGKIYGLYLDKVEASVDMDISVSVDYGDD